MPSPAGWSARSIAPGTRIPIPDASAPSIASTARNTTTPFAICFALNVDVKPLLPGDETADGSFDNFADSLSISTAHLERYLSVARQVTRLAVGLPPASPGLERFEIPLFVMQDDRQSEDLPFGSRGGIAVTTTFRSTASISSRSACSGSIRTTSRAWAGRSSSMFASMASCRSASRSAAKRRGEPAAASYAGDGEPGFAGDDSWEKYMQVGGDAGLEVRVPVDCRSARRRRVVRAGDVGARRPAAAAAARPRDRERSGLHGLRERRLGPDRRASDTGAGAAGDAQPARIFVCQPALQKTGLRHEDSVADGAAGVSPTGDQCGHQHAVGVFRSGRAMAAAFDGGIQFALERMLVDPDFLLACAIATHAAAATS